jgi:hypothetical protein
MPISHYVGLILSHGVQMCSFFSIICCNRLENASRYKTSLKQITLVMFIGYLDFDGPSEPSQSVSRAKTHKTLKCTFWSKIGLFGRFGKYSGIAPVHLLYRRGTGRAEHSTFPGRPEFFYAWPLPTTLYCYLPPQSTPKTPKNLKSPSNPSKSHENVKKLPQPPRDPTLKGWTLTGFKTSSFLLTYQQ